MTIHTIPHPDRHAALDLALRLIAVTVAAVVILGLLPVLIDLAA